MTRKTLAEKKLAKQHKKKHLLQLASVQTKKNVKLADNKDESIPDLGVIQADNSKAIVYFRGDLTRSISVILIIIALEIVFYFASMR